ncbi:MAG TPA: spermidine/putrescine ABC transporter substrate-binding protein, partial [Allocoleopsis sp.]
QISKRLTLVDDVREVLGLALKMLGYSYNSTNPDELQQAYQKLLDLKPAIASFTTDAWQQQILTGDLFIAMCYSADANKIMQENNKLKYFIPHSGTSLWMDTMVIPKTAPNPDGAYAWLNYILQPDISAEISQRLSFATPNKAAFDLLPKTAQKNPSLFPAEDVLSKCDSIEDVGKFAEVYDAYWTKLRS